MTTLQKAADRTGARSTAALPSPAAKASVKKGGKDPAVPPSLKRRHALQLFKTEMCKFYLQGRCENGDTCSYAHSPNDIRRKPDLTATSMCKVVQNGGNCQNPNCRFAHDEEELRATHGFYKMKMCGFVKFGRCKNGDSCRFAHSSTELRAAKPPAPNAEEDLLQKKKSEAGSTASLSVAGSASEQQGLRELRERVPAPPRPWHAISDNEGLSAGMFDGGAVMQQLAEVQHQASELEAAVMMLSAKAGSTGNQEGQGRSAEILAEGRKRERKQGPQLSASGGSVAGSSGAGGRRSSSSPTATTSMGMLGTDAGSWSVSSGNSSATEFPLSEQSSGRRTPAGTSGSRQELERTKENCGGSSESGSGTGQSGGKTSLLITNIPMYLTQGALLSMLEDLTPQMRGKYNFFYCPWDESVCQNLSYAIINFEEPVDAKAFEERWANKEICTGCRGQKVLRVMKFDIQGLQANLNYFSTVEVTKCADLRFRPLVRRTPGKPLQPLLLSENANLLPEGSVARKPQGLSTLNGTFDVQAAPPPKQYKAEGPSTTSMAASSRKTSAKTSRSDTAKKHGGEGWQRRNLTSSLNAAAEVYDGSYAAHNGYWSQGQTMPMMAWGGSANGGGGQGSARMSQQVMGMPWFSDQPGFVSVVGILPTNPMNDNAMGAMSMPMGANNQMSEAGAGADHRLQQHMVQQCLLLGNNGNQNTYLIPVQPSGASWNANEEVYTD
eukprot:TRINITY_DN29745_c0_g1_i1.p1 TRINITY_DN29745_c0_g1~~TRINITY_DN29745_c0_g1_i1.p1  ORF type:complete len:723 (-),score=185.53 TRINITY_DN29745_c0_g1_i1:328-2496(-)